MNEVLWSEPAGLHLDELPAGHSPRVWGPLFALGAIEEFVDTCPRRGLRIGSRLPAPVARDMGEAHAERLNVAGRMRSVRLSP